MNPAGGEENDGDRNGHDAKSDRRLQPSAKRAPEQHDRNEHEAQLEQNEPEESGAPARRAALANAANRLEKLLDETIAEGVDVTYDLKPNRGDPTARSTSEVAEALVRKFAHQRFEPSGFTKNPEIRNASSIIDYVFRWMALQFLPDYRQANGLKQPDLPIPGLLEELKKKINRPVPELPLSEEETTILLRSDATNGGTGAGNGHGATQARTITNISDAVAHFQQDAPTCPNCGHVTVRNGACYKCLNCGESLGCS